MPKATFILNSKLLVIKFIITQETHLASLCDWWVYSPNLGKRIFGSGRSEPGFKPPQVFSWVKLC